MKKVCLTLTVFVVFILATHNTHAEESEWEWTSTKGETKSKFSGGKINKRIARGGAFNVSPNLITSSSRLSLFSKNRLFNVGFRCAK